MSTKSYILIPYHLQDHNIQSWKKSYFPLYLRGTTMFCGAKNLFLRVDMDQQIPNYCS
jgi:hypothetical protein